MKLTTTFQNVTVNKSARVTCKSVTIARPANVIDCAVFTAQIENAIIDRNIELCVSDSMTLREQADETKNDERRARLVTLADEFDDNVTSLKAMRHDDIPEYHHTIAEVVAYTECTAMRGTKNDSRVYKGFYDCFDMARELGRKGTTSNKAVQPLADALREALNTAIENDGNGDDITKRFKARVNVDMAKNLVFGAGFVRTGKLGRAGFPIHHMDVREFTCQALNMCLAKTFDFTDIKKLTPAKRNEF